MTSKIIFWTDENKRSMNDFFLQIKIKTKTQMSTINIYYQSFSNLLVQQNDLQNKARGKWKKAVTWIGLLMDDFPRMDNTHEMMIGGVLI